MEKMGKLHIAGMLPDELAAWLNAHQVARFRAKQIFQWVHRHCVRDFTDMQNLPRDVITLLESEFSTPSSVQEIISRQSIDGTKKYLFALEDNQTIETVLIPEGERSTLCVSSQVGCAMNCSFCATGQGGYGRNLLAGEIMGQALWVQHELAKSGRTLTNIVFMGMGEPFANYSEVQKAIRILNHPEGLNLGQRRLTISTCGVVPEIRRFADEQTQVNLAVSLHAPNNAKRSQIMPVNKRFPIEELIAACRYYVEQTHRRISFEYALIEGFNDSIADARELASLLHGLLCHCNLIPVNPVEQYSRPDSDVVQKFAEVLESGGIPVTVRKERGTDIEAACGQLRQQNQDLTE